MKGNFFVKKTKLTHLKKEYVWNRLEEWQDATGCSSREKPEESGIALGKPKKR